MQDVKQIRNTVILGHGNSGKTTLADALLFTAGAVNRIGKVDDGSSVMDFEPEEIKRQITISTAFNHVTWKKSEIFSVTPQAMITSSMKRNLRCRWLIVPS